MLNMVGLVSGTRYEVLSNRVNKGLLPESVRRSSLDVAYWIYLCIDIHAYIYIYMYMYIYVCIYIYMRRDMCRSIYIHT